MVKKINTNKITYSTNIISGAYVPLTTDGNIMVNGILASCYAEFHHDLAHIVMTPMQRFPELLQWLFGENTGIPVFVTTAKVLGFLLWPQDAF